MKNLTFVTLFLMIILITIDARKTSKSRSSGSGRGSSRKTNYNPQPSVPTSFSNPQASAPKPSLFGWQEKPAARNTHSYPSKQSNPTSRQNQNHGYPSSQTGLSGNTPAKQPPSYQESIQRSNTPQQNVQRSGSQPNPAYPASNGLSGSSGSAGYPQGSGLSGTGSGSAHTSGIGYPQHNGAVGTGAGYPHGSGSSGGVGAPPSYAASKPGAAGNYPAYSGSHNNYPPQGPPPPYSSHGSYGGYSGYGGHGFMPNPQMPGYFGNYGNNYGKGFGGVSRSGSALTGLGLAGAGIGTVLTGLALWNLARSTGNHHHTVIYDNRGQPVAVAPANGTDPAVDSILKDLVNCTLTISNDNTTEVLAIPCAIATSFTPDANVKDANAANSNSDNTKCTVTVVTKEGQEFMTTIPCSILLNTAAENNVTEPPINVSNPGIVNDTIVSNNDTQNQPSALKLSGESGADNVACTTQENGEVRDPINPCLAVTHNLTVIPLEQTKPTSPSTQNHN